MYAGLVDGNYAQDSSYRLPDNPWLVDFDLLRLHLLFMLLCDTLARTLLMPAELPVGSLTALAGAPLFIYLLYKNKKRY